MRVDKWLWAARFFKTRAQASKACELGRVEMQQQRIKPSRELRAGDFLKIRTEAGDYDIQVLALSEMRGPAAVAQTLYAESEESKEARRKQAEERKTLHASEIIPQSKPSKRDRRQIERFRRRFQ